MVELETKNQFLSAQTQAHEALCAGGEDWLRETRRAAFARFLSSGLPSRRDEDWKYTGVDLIAEHIEGVAGPQAFAPALDLAPYQLAGARPHLLVFIDGHYAAGLSEPGSAPGARLDSLSSAIAKTPERLREQLGDTDSLRWFEALNAAFLNDGACIEIEADTELAYPVHLLFVATTASAAKAAHPRVLVRMGANSRARLIEHYVGTADHPYLVNTVTDIHLDRGAALEHCTIQQQGAKGYHVGSLRVRQAEDSTLSAHSLSLGARLARHDVYAALAGQGSSCTLNGVYITDGRQHIDNHTSIDHVVPRCTSREHYKGILAGRSRGVFNGRVQVREQAQHTDAQQSNNNLLLSREAEIDTKPQLEIYADDVKCAHGATVGELDLDAVFYLRSRGIEDMVARSLLTYSFVGELLRKVEPEALRRRLEELVLARLPDGGRVRELI